MSNIAIKAENLGKAYQLGEIGTGTISRDLERWYARIRGKEDPFLTIGETNDRSQKGMSDVIWSLKDINFEIEQGDAVGIIGRNGAGKSTLLKILSKVTSPTIGKISGRGRIASLLEVGTGFHPELTGRENIFLNGAILGMRNIEIRKHFDAIVDFAGIERYIDTPVKRYSSGMYVRLAFAVAAHLESEILIVDEVLAVGDSEFQKKCLGKMSDVSKGEGRTVLFVSHNMASIKQLCNKGILLERGMLNSLGSADTIINNYVNSSNRDSFYSVMSNPLKTIQILSLKICDEKGNIKQEFENKEDIFVEFCIKNISTESGLRFNLGILNQYDQLLIVDRLLIGYGEMLNYKAIIPANILTSNTYKISLAIDVPSVTLFELLMDKVSFEIIDTGSKESQFSDIDNGIISSPLKWLKI